MGHGTKLMTRRWLPYDIAKQVVKKHNVTSEARFYKWHDATKPIGIPKRPHRVYLDEWTYWHEFLGLDKPNPWYGDVVRKTPFLPYHEAVKFVQQQGWKTQRQYYLGVKARHHDILPLRPNLHYANKGWISWPVFVGKSIVNYVENAELNVSVLVIAVNTDLPGGYVYIFIKNTHHEAKQFIEHNNLKVIKVYQYEKQRHGDIANVISHFANSKGNSLYLTSNINAIISCFDEMLLYATL